MDGRTRAESFVEKSYFPNMERTLEQVGVVGGNEESQMNTGDVDGKNTIHRRVEK